MATEVAVPTRDFDALMQKPLGEITKGPYMALVRLDLSVSAVTPQLESPEKVTFTIRLSPGILDTLKPERMLDVPVLVTDMFGNVVFKTYPMSSHGDAKTDTVDVPVADRSIFDNQTDPGRYIMVLVDPLNAISERDEKNNWAKAYCYTLG